jgi:hypothetical protein
MRSLWSWASFLVVIAALTWLLCSSSPESALAPVDADHVIPAGQTDPRCYLVEFIASNEGSGIDPSLEFIREKLERPPLDVFDSHVSRQHGELGETLVLLEGTRVQFTLVEERDSETYYHLLGIDSSDQARFEVTSPWPDDGPIVFGVAAVDEPYVFVVAHCP